MSAARHGDEREAGPSGPQHHALQIDALQALPVPELLALAEREGIDAIGLDRQELLFEILRRQAAKFGQAYCEGVLDVLPDGFGFLRNRRAGYRPGPDDIYVSPTQVRRLNLKRGHWIAGPIRPPRENERYFALLHVDAINGGTVEQLRQRIPFADRTPIVPTRRLRLHAPGAGTATRAIDLLAPIAHGQRCLILAPPQSGRSKLLTEIAAGIVHNHRDTTVLVLLIDERPEDVTAVRRGVGNLGEVVAATFDEPPARHMELADLVLDKARRAVEAGQDVALLVDSLTALTRAHNLQQPHSGKIVCAGLDASALLPTKRLFGAARQCEEGGALTIIATALTDNGLHVDEAIAADLRGKGNCEIVLDRRLAELHAYPAIDVARTGTRREDEIVGPAEAAQLRALRGLLLREPEDARLATLLRLLAQHPNDGDLLAHAARALA